MFGVLKGFENGQGFRPLCRNKHPAMHDAYSCLRSNLQPNLARPLGKTPRGSRILSANDDKAEIADRCAIRLRVPVDHDDTQATHCRSKRMRETNYASADNR